MKNKVGLALSGGGYRATAFHLGTLRKLKELNVLEKIDVISSISGGSITGAYYSLFGKNFDDFEKGLLKGLKRSSVITAIFYAIFLVVIIIFSFALVKLWWLKVIWAFTITLILMIFQFSVFPVSYFVEQRYRRIFFKDFKIKDLSTRPLLCINSTNIESGRQFSFSRLKMSDSRYSHPTDGTKAIYFRHKDFPVSKAVMASTCVPFAFTPVKLAKKFYQNQVDFHRIKPLLIDGGVYDNQGIHKLTQKGSDYYCDNIIISDAGTGYQPWFKNNIISLLIKTSALFMNRITNIQFINNIILNKYLDNREIAYFSLWYDPNESIKYFVEFLKRKILSNSVIQAHNLTEELIETKSEEELVEIMKAKVNYDELKRRFPTKEEIEIAKKVGTGLSPLKDKKMEALLKVSESLTEIQIRLYFPSVLH